MYIKFQFKTFRKLCMAVVHKQSWTNEKQYIDSSGEIGIVLTADVHGSYGDSP